MATKKETQQATIYDEIPIEIAQNLALLREDLDQKIPSKELDRNLLIATWNIREFSGLTRKWMSETKDSPRRDLHSVLTDVNKSASGGYERMAYLFDTRRVQLSGLAGEIVIPNEWVKDPEKVINEQFVRSPYAVSFRTCDKTFILVTVHIIYGKSSNDRIKEVKGIAKWLSDWASDINAYDQNLIVLGDFNIDERGDLLDKTFLSEGLYVPEQLQQLTRSIFHATKYYDQIAWFNTKKGKRPKLSLEFLDAGNYDFVPTALSNRGLSKTSVSFMMSDHYPLWANFQI